MPNIGGISYRIIRGNEADLQKIYNKTYKDKENRKQAGLEKAYVPRAQRTTVSEYSKIDGDYIIMVRSDNNGYMGKTGWYGHDTWNVSLGTDVAPAYQSFPTGSKVRIWRILLRLRMMDEDPTGNPTITTVNATKMPLKEWIRVLRDFGYTEGVEEHPNIPEEVMTYFKNSGEYLVKDPVPDRQFPEGSEGDEEEEDKKDEVKNSCNIFNRTFFDIIKV